MRLPRFDGVCQRSGVVGGGHSAGVVCMSTCIALRTRPLLLGTQQVEIDAERTHSPSSSYTPTSSQTGIALCRQRRCMHSLMGIKQPHAVA